MVWIYIRNSFNFKFIKYFGSSHLLFYIENISFAIILYFGFNNNLRIIFFYVFTFPISVLIQILYRWIQTKEKVSFLVLN